MRAPSSRGRGLKSGDSGLGTRDSGASTLLFVGVAVDWDDLGAKQRKLALAGQVVLEPVEFLAEVRHVLERAVHRGETHVADVVELAQLRHHELADPPRCDLALRSEEHTSE